MNASEGVFEPETGIVFSITAIHLWQTSNNPYTSRDPGVLYGQFID